MSITATKTIRQYNTDAENLLTNADAIWEKGDEATLEERQQAKAWTEEAEQIAAELEKSAVKDAQLTANRVRNQIGAALPPSRPSFGGGNANPPVLPFTAGRDGASLMGGNAHDALKSVGDRFTEHPTYLNWIKSLVPEGGEPPEMPQVHCPPIAIKTLIASGGATTGAPLMFPDHRDIIVPAPFRPFVVRDVVTVLPTTAGSVDYVRITGYTNNAAEVAEATAATGTSGTKPESELLTARITDLIKTIAHWIPITTQALADAPQLRGIIDTFLRQGLEEKCENVLIATILAASGVQNQAFATDAITTTRKARTKVATPGRAVPNAYIMNPLDWEAIDLTQDAEQRYYFGGPQVLGTPRLWGLPVVVTEGMPEGTATVGDHKQAVIWDRMAATVKTGTIDAYFVRNLLVILAEMRAGFGVLRAPALVEIDMSAAALAAREKRRGGDKGTPAKKHE